MELATEGTAHMESVGVIVYMEGINIMTVINHMGDIGNMKNMVTEGILCTKSGQIIGVEDIIILEYEEFNDERHTSL